MTTGRLFMVRDVIVMRVDWNGKRASIFSCFFSSLVQFKNTNTHIHSISFKIVKPFARRSKWSSNANSLTYLSRFLSIICSAIFRLPSLPKITSGSAQIYIRRRRINKCSSTHNITLEVHIVREEDISSV